MKKCFCWKWKKKQRSSQQDDYEILEKWKKLVDENEIKTVDIETVMRWMIDYPNKDTYIDWKDRDGRTALNFAIVFKRLDIAKLLLEHGADCNIADNDGMTALILAANRGLKETVQLVLDKGADSNTSDKDGMTALMLASYYGHIEIVELLLLTGAKVSIANNDGETALSLAINRGHTNIVELLSKNGARSAIVDDYGNADAFMKACFYGQSDAVELLLSKGADVNTADQNGWTALMHASNKGHNDVVGLLLTRGADVTIANDIGETALMYASYEGHTNIVELLLESGADMTRGNKFGVTALMWASMRGRTDTVEVLLEKGLDIAITEKYRKHYKRLDLAKSLLEHGTDINISNKWGYNALTIAALGGHTKIIDLLLTKGADIKIVDKKGWTVMMHAANNGHADTVQLLLERGASRITTNKDGDTAFILAFKQGHIKVLELLSDEGVDPNICISDGRTLLHQTCLRNNQSNAQQVLEFGTDENKIDDYGHTALFYAAEKGLADMVELLLNHNADGNKTDERRLIERTDAAGRDGSFYSVKDGRTPLFVAAQNGHRNIVAQLLQHGADPYLCNNESQIPRDVSIVHDSIQQLFRIQDFFDHREQGSAYQKAYLTCRELSYLSKKEKTPPPTLEDIVHDIVKYPHFAKKFMELYQENREIINWLDQDGRTVRQVACKECREAILFLGQYDLDDQPMYESPTCKIYSARDYGGRDEENIKKQPRRVAMKFMENKDHFLTEIRARRNEDSSQRFSSEFVTPDLAAYSADEDPDYAKACKSWKTKGNSTDLLPGQCIVMERGERSLLESMNAENLSAKHKDLQRREILLTLCRIFSYLHEMGYVHGDIKPHNVVRHIGPNVTWKAIDFDSCTKVGDVLGLKLTTGSAPPEMLKVIQKKDSDTQSSGKSKVVLRQPMGGVEESELVVADPSFDVWSYGILLYQLVTGRSFFHCDLQGNVDNAGLKELAYLTEDHINKKLDGVEDVNARVLLSRILRLDPKERPTMSAIENDYYFHPSESSHGRRAEFFGKEVFRGLSDNSLFVASHRSIAEKNANEESENIEDAEMFLSSKSDFSYFKLRDEDKDWSDKLLNSEIETFHFDKLGGMGEKPKLIDGDAIYNNDFLRSLLSSKGPDYFMGFLVEYFGLYEIMSDAHEVCQGIKTNLVSDVKDLKGIFIKLFVRGKGLNDAVRGTLFCNSIDQFKYVGRQLKERYGYNVYIKPPKSEAGAWPIPKLLIYGNRRYHGLCLSVEIQFSTVYMHLATHASNNHLVYEAIRESTLYLGDKDEDFQKFLQLMNEQYIDTEGFLRNEGEQENRFEILVEKIDDKDGGDTDTKEPNLKYLTRATGFITSGRICCGDRRFQFMSPNKDDWQRFSASSFVVNKSLTLLSSHSYWSEESYDLEGKSVEFVVSFKGRGLAIAGIGTEKCLHGSLEIRGGGARCSVHVGRSKFVVRKNGVEETFREKKLPDQEKATISFKMEDGVVSVSFVGSKSTADKEIESFQVDLSADQRYYLYMRAPPGVHDAKFHDINIVSWI